MRESLKQRLNQGDLLLGTVVTLAAPEVGEILAGAGFDWLFIDLEHGSLELADARRIVQATSAASPCLLRLPAAEEVWIKKGLDVGAAGIIIPQVRSLAEAERAVRLCKYPPLGERSAGVARAQGYGMDFQNYLQRANDEVVVVLQIEHHQAVEQIGAIVAIPGIDALFVGPYDLSGSMGRLGQIDDAKVLAAIDKVTAAAQAAQIPLGIFGATAASMQPYRAQGYRLLAVAIDTLLLGTAARQMLAQLSPTTAE